MTTDNLILHLPTRTETANYRATLSWETFANGAYQLATIQKEVTLLAQPNAQGCAVDFRTSLPVLTKQDDVEPLEEMALRLAALYEWVSVQAAPTGQLLALLNHEAVLKNWTRLSQELRASTTEDDQITSSILRFLSAQLQSPANYLRSLQHDYIYQTLLPDFYAQSLSSPTMPVRSRHFSNFFDKLPLWFSEQVTLLPTAESQQLSLSLQGTLDAQKTDVPAVCEQIAHALRMATGSEVALPAPHFHYQALYTLEASTGLPSSVELGVHVRAGQVYNKEYSLTINRV